MKAKDSPAVTTRADRGQSSAGLGQLRSVGVTAGQQVSAGIFGRASALEFNDQPAHGPS
jgi:hypothetical protein